MLKRVVVRLLLVAIPCCFSYLASRPKARPAGPAFVVCSFEDGAIVIAPQYQQCGVPGTASAGTGEGTRILRVLPSAQEPTPQKRSGRLLVSVDLFRDGSEIKVQ